MVMIMVNIADPKARLSEFLEAVGEGEHLVICKHNRPVAELRPIEAGGRPAGSEPMFPDETFMTDAFWEPMSETELREWEGGDVFPARVAERPAETATPPVAEAERRS